MKSGAANEYLRSKLATHQTTQRVQIFLVALISLVSVVLCAVPSSASPALAGTPTTTSSGGYDATTKSASQTPASEIRVLAKAPSISRPEAVAAAKPFSISAYRTGAKSANGPTSQVLLKSSKQLQSKFKHALDFGVTGNYSRANATKFSEALNRHINNPEVPQEK